MLQLLTSSHHADVIRDSKIQIYRHEMQNLVKVTQGYVSMQL